MDIYKAAVELLRSTPEAKRWAELDRAFERAAVHPPVAWDFPVKACQAVGSPPEQALTAVAAVTCVHMAIMLVDDILDEDPRGAYHQLGIGRASNLASGLNGLGIELISTSKTCPDPARAAAALASLIASIAYGQDLDVQNARTEEGYWAVARAKSSPYFAGALRVGAIFGNADLKTEDGLQRFGQVFGEIMQIHDDLNDSLEVPANVDWLHGRAALPILFAELVDHPERERFMELKSQVTNPAVLEEAQSILVSCGAISYSVNELMRRDKKAREMLDEIKLVNSEPLRQLLDQAIVPVQHLFASVGANFPG